MSLKVYHRKRKFDRTPEPFGEGVQIEGQLRFFIQLHKSSHLHFDFRLEIGGTLKSWALPSGLTQTPSEQKLAVEVEDHPLEYGSFEGIIPRGNYGAGTVMLWDKGHYLERSSKNRKQSEANLQEGLKKGHITFILRGEKLKGEFALIRTRSQNWILVKKQDQFASRRPVEFKNISLISGRSLAEIARHALEENAVWSRVSKKAEEKRQPPKNLKRALGDTKAQTAKFVSPMKPKKWSKTFEDKNWIFFDKAGGQHLQIVQKGTLRVFNRMGTDVTQKFKTDLKNTQFPQVDFVLDATFNNDKFFALDLLNYDGRNLTQMAFSDRLKLLNQHFKSKKNIQVLKPDKHQKLITQLERHPNQPFWARYKHAPYIRGIANEWLEIYYKEDPSSTEEPYQPVMIKTKRSEQTSRRVHNRLTLTHLNKIYFPEDNLSKGDLANYYEKVLPYILPAMKNRLQSLHRHPNGIFADHFFQKDLSGYKPKFVKTHRVYSQSAEKTIEYMLCQNPESLLYMVNLGCIELNAWLSDYKKLDHPRFCVIDLDPDGNSFDEVIEVAKAYKKLFDKIQIDCWVKTSGATGLHIGVPLNRQSYTFDQSREFAQLASQIIQRDFSNTSTVRVPARRKRKIYLDCLQNRRGQTLVVPYCVRPRSGAPVSTPLRWSELKRGLRPEKFHIGNTLRRIKKHGDLWAPMLTRHTNLRLAMARLHKLTYTDPV